MLIHALSALCIVLLLFHIPVVTKTLDNKRIGITVPAAPWTITLPGDKLIVEEKQIKPDGRQGYFLISDNKNKVEISLFIEPAAECKNSKECRDMVWKLGNPSWENPQNVVLSEIEGISFFEFLIPSFRGKPVQQQNMYAEFVVDGYWVDLHISKVLYKLQDHEIFERLIKSVKFEPKK
jgi:hypothetical protein